MLEILLFFCKTVILVIAILALIAGIIAIIARSKLKPELEVKDLNEQYQEYKDILQAETLPKDELKKLRKQQKKDKKAEKKNSKKS